MIIIANVNGKIRVFIVEFQSRKTDQKLGLAEIKPPSETNNKDNEVIAILTKLGLSTELTTKENITFVLHQHTSIDVSSLGDGYKDDFFLPKKQDQAVNSQSLDCGDKHQSAQAKEQEEKRQKPVNWESSIANQVIFVSSDQMLSFHQKKM